MATPLDIGLLGHFSTIFPFLLVLIFVYVVLAKSPWFQDKQAFAFFIALILAALTMFSPIAVKTINLMAPWFVLLVIFGILFILAYVAFGVKEESILNVLTSKEYGGTFAWWVIALMLIIGLGSLATVISEEVGFTELPEDDEAEKAAEPEPIGFWGTLFHPKVLGIIFLLLVAMFTISKLAGKAE